MRATLGTGVVVAIVLCGLITLAGFGVEATGVIVALAVGLALLPLPFLLALALWIDRFEPEPRRLLVEMFLWGAFVATLVAGIANEVGQSVVSGSLGKGAGEIYGGSISAPVIEESMKGAAIWLVWRRTRDEIDGVVDGIVYAMVVALGFATVENVYYYAQGAADHGVVGALGVFVARGLFSPLAHPLFTSATGIGFGIAATTRRPWVRRVAPFLGLGVAMLLHSAWNSSALSGETVLAVYVLFFVPLFTMLVVFVVIARRRETSVVREELQPELAEGVLEPAEVNELASFTLRKSALKRARARGGRDARTALRRYHHAATELAFLRRRIDRADGPRQASLRAREPGERAEMLRLRGLTTAAA
jgi:RsiW-degrading membrane proteinase PrsW (M82 family)